jgi:membrane-associated protease RseP (regulator of RpoE activity)
MLQASIIVITAILVLYFIVGASIPGTWKFALGLLEMFVVGQILIKHYAFTGEYGMIMLRTKKGLKIINDVARSEGLWKFLADTGLVFSYGALSFLLMKNNVNWKNGVLGFIMLIALSGLIAPAVLPFLSENVQGIVSVKQSSVSGIAALLLPVSLIILLGGGFFAALFISLLAYGGYVLYAIISTLFLGTSALSQTSPGATLLLPGVTIPLVEGIIALVVILVVHEGAHAVLGRIARVPILSSGIVLFGIIPVGAFVEPDEEKTKQTRVLIAGSASNMFTSVLVFILFIAFLFATIPYRETGLLVVSGLEKGTIIYTINGQNALNYANMTIPKNSTVVLGTSAGDISVKTDEKSWKDITFYPLDGSLLFAKFKLWYLSSIYLILGLTFALNFVIGTVNLLPLPFFDGYRILELNVKNKKIVAALMYLTIAGFLLNLLPNLFLK